MIALGALTGCKDFLEEAPVLDQSDEMTLSTIEGLNSATAAAYGVLADAGWYGADQILMNEMKTSNGKKNINNKWDSGRLNDEYNLNYTENNTVGCWVDAYYVISAVNNVIDALPNVEGDEALKNNLKAECLFLRALSHFDLVRTYAMPYEYKNGAQDGVPVVLHTDPNARPERNTVAEVYTQILEDLKEADKLLAADYQRPGTDDRAYISKEAVWALIARASLYCGQNQQAADYAGKVIASSKFNLWSKADLKDGKCYAEDTHKGGEVIFEVYGLKANEFDPYRDSVCYMTTPGGYGDGAVSDDLMNLYSEDDVRSTLFLEDSGVYWTAKYQGKGFSNPDVNNVIIFRLSEMYLIRAEAVTKGATGANALEDLNKIATTRGAAAYNNAGIEAILAERQKELAWEGHLWYDLGRFGKDMTRVDFQGAAASQNVRSWNDATDYYKWAMPIPAHEYRTNENLTHNPGWN